MLSLEVYYQTRVHPPKRLFTSLLPSAARHLKLGKRVLNVELSIIGNRTMALLNRHYHKKNYPTDVISLSYFESRMQDPFIGEIFICLPFAKAQAKKIGQSLNEELRFLFIHGLLHLFGYDHKKLKEEAVMKRLAYRILGRK